MRSVACMLCVQSLSRIRCKYEKKKKKKIHVYFEVGKFKGEVTDNIVRTYVRTLKKSRRIECNIYFALFLSIFFPSMEIVIRLFVFSQKLLHIFVLGNLRRESQAILTRYKKSVQIKFILHYNSWKYFKTQIEIVKSRKRWIFHEKFCNVYSDYCRILLLLLLLLLLMFKRQNDRAKY